MRPVWLPLTLSLLTALPAIAQTNQGAISGTVLHDNGRPFQGVLVCTWVRDAPANSKDSRGNCPAATSDQAGQFRIDHLAMGAIGLEAIKPEDGYIAFAGTSVSQIVTLTPDQSTATIVLKLGPKAGRLMPTVTNQVTGKPVTTYQVSWTFFGTDETNSSISGGQEVRPGIKGAIVPPDKYLVLSVIADGYKKWFYHDPSDLSRPAFLRLQPGEEKELPVELEPQLPEVH